MTAMAICNRSSERHESILVEKIDAASPIWTSGEPNMIRSVIMPVVVEWPTTNAAAHSAVVNDGQSWPRVLHDG